MSAITSFLKSVQAQFGTAGLVVVVLAGLVALVIALKVAKFVFKLVFFLVALGILGFAAWWVYVQYHTTP